MDSYKLIGYGCLLIALAIRFGKAKVPSELIWLVVGLILIRPRTVYGEVTAGSLPGILEAAAS